MVQRWQLATNLIKLKSSMQYFRAKRPEVYGKFLRFQENLYHLRDLPADQRTGLVHKFKFDRGEWAQKMVNALCDYNLVLVDDSSKDKKWTWHETRVVMKHILMKQIEPVSASSVWNRDTAKAVCAELRQSGRQFSIDEVIQHAQEWGYRLGMTAAELLSE